MSSNPEKQCIGCGDTDEMARLERCGICMRFFCPDCSYRASGRRFCSDNCARTFFYGDIDDDDEDAGSDE
jgi:hypothetical protein